jgi:hypothetical protein
MNKQSNKRNKQSSKVNVRQYNGVNRAVLSDIHFTPLFTSLYCLTFILLLCLPHCIVWHSFYCSVYSVYCSVYSFYRSVYPNILSDIDFTALFTPLFCLTFNLLLCLPHCFVWHSFYCSVYPIVLSDIHFTPLF